MDPQAEAPAEAATEAMDLPHAIGEALEAAIRAAAKQGADLSALREVTFAFADDGSIAVTVDGADFAVTADDIAAMAARDSVPPPPPAA